LLRVLGYLKQTLNDVLTLECDTANTMTWYIDASFAVHDDMKSHTGAILFLGKGAVLSSSTKQKANSRSSTEAELNAIDDKVAKILWSKRFMDTQGYPMRTVICQDNTSTMRLAMNGKESSGKRTRHFDIKLFYITDLIKHGYAEIIYCSSDAMIADYMTKPLLGAKFHLFRDIILNLHDKHHHLEQQECVGGKSINH
jgi:hypothetical protein